MNLSINEEEYVYFLKESIAILRKNITSTKNIKEKAKYAKRVQYLENIKSVTIKKKLYNKPVSGKNLDKILITSRKKAQSSVNENIEIDIIRKFFNDVSEKAILSEEDKFNPMDIEDLSDIDNASEMIRGNIIETDQAVRVMSKIIELKEYLRGKKRAIEGGKELNKADDIEYLLENYNKTAVATRGGELQLLTANDNKLLYHHMEECKKLQNDIMSNVKRSSSSSTNGEEEFQEEVKKMSVMISSIQTIIKANYRKKVNSEGKTQSSFNR